MGSLTLLHAFMDMNTLWAFHQDKFFNEEKPFYRMASGLALLGWYTYSWKLFPMAPVSETQTVSEASRQYSVNINDVGSGVRKAKRKQGNRTDSRGGRKRHAGSLPACQVCFNSGSGFHYGADTCEPCKVISWSKYIAFYCNAVYLLLLLHRHILVFFLENWLLILANFG